jgi:hypothetical protein
MVAICQMIVAGTCRSSKEVWWKSVRLGGVKLFASSRVRGLTHCGGMAHVQAIHNLGHTTNMT